MLDLIREVPNPYCPLSWTREGNLLTTFLEVCIIHLPFSCALTWWWCFSYQIESQALNQRVYWCQYRNSPNTNEGHVEIFRSWVKFLSGANLCICSRAIELKYFLKSIYSGDLGCRTFPILTPWRKNELHCLYVYLVGSERYATLYATVLAWDEMSWTFSLSIPSRWSIFCSFFTNDLPERKWVAPTGHHPLLCACLFWTHLAQACHPLQS